MPKALIIMILAGLMLFGAGLAQAEITVTIQSVDPESGAIGDGDSATISWKIDADGESGNWQFEIGGDGTWDSGEVASSSDASGTFGGTTQGSSTISYLDLDDGDGDYTIYFIAEDSSDSTNYDSTSTTITLDNPPDMVTGVSAGNGNSKIFLDWEGLDVDDIAYYLIYYATQSGSGAADYDGVQASEGVSPINAGDGTSFILNGLTNGVKYYIRVSAVDESSIEGELSQEASATPLESQGLTEIVDEEGGCFIATAAFGDLNHPMVVSLRSFRDRFLMNSDSGRTFVSTYYTYSPPLASWISGRPAVKTMVRVALVPVAWYADSSVRWPVMALLIPLLVALAFSGAAYFAIVRVRRKGR